LSSGSPTRLLATTNQRDLLLVAEVDPMTIQECGHTKGGPGQRWRRQSAWTCSPCVPFDTTTRAFDLVNIVAVEPGDIPA
jgi:hypothetical protein